MGLCLSTSNKTDHGLARTPSSYDGAHRNPLRYPESDGQAKPNPKSASELYKSASIQQRIKAAEQAHRTS